MQEVVYSFHYLVNVLYTVRENGEDRVSSNAGQNISKCDKLANGLKKIKKLHLTLTLTELRILIRLSTRAESRLWGTLFYVEGDFDHSTTKSTVEYRMSFTQWWKKPTQNQ